MTGYGRPGGSAAKLRAAIHERWRLHQASGDLPTSNRFILYELRQFNSGVLYGYKSRSQGHSEDQYVSEASKWLRDEGLIPWPDIVDETRSLTTYRYAATVAEYLIDSLDYARIDLWAGEPPPLLLCESRTFGGVMDRTLAPRYLCAVSATNGQAGGFLHTNIAPILRGSGKRRPVLYIGDHDYRGHGIERNTRRVLEEIVGPLDWTRVALTESQVRHHKLPRVQKWDGGLKRSFPAVEVEALGQGTVTGIVEAAIKDLLPDPLEDVQVREAEQREQARRRLTRPEKSRRSRNALARSRAKDRMLAWQDAHPHASEAEQQRILQAFYEQALGEIWDDAPDD
jgi:hypothetical protein